MAYSMAKKKKTDGNVSPHVTLNADCCFFSEKSTEVTATKAERGAGEGAATGERAWEREAANC